MVGKQENLKYAHGEVQEQFAQTLAVALDNPHGTELQCCVTYSKPCGCIRKFILGGEKWKEDASLQLKNSDDFDATLVMARDKSMIGSAQRERAKELVVIYEHAAELKKEKCYAFNNAEVEGKSLKELRGMIGLGNGRKRSKKYEEYVLQMRSRLRNQYNLCEKAAQKLLGYSINFLYKKLRTNPQKTSRLVATNKAERASKAPRHLIPLEELREMGRKPSGANQCCGRNCISRLASQHFEKIEDWRRRLEGSGQRVAQEIVAEVLRASSSSLDGQSNFCQNLVHWVTGCSFKKIRRVRDHLKKDPMSLPEHGLKKYWKDKVKNKPKTEPLQKIPKTERKDYTNGDMMPPDGNNFYGMYHQNPLQLQQSNMDIQYNHMAENTYAPMVNKMPSKLTHFSGDRGTATPTTWSATNHNNSNNMLPPGGMFGSSEADMKPLHMQSAVHGYLHQMQGNHETKNLNLATTNNSHSYQYQQPNMQNASLALAGHYGTSQGQLPNSSYQDAAATVSGNSGTNHRYMNQQQSNNFGGMQNNDGTQAARGSVILHTAGSQLGNNPEELMPYSLSTASTVTGRTSDVFNHPVQSNGGNHNEMIGMAFNAPAGQHYYIATPTNLHENEFLHGNMSTGLTPFILSNGDPNSLENRNGDPYRQPFYILSPVATDGGFTASDMKNLQNLQHIPLTPVQILPTPCLQPGKNLDPNNSGKQDQFVFPLPLANPEAFQGDYAKLTSAENQNNIAGSMQFPVSTALTSLAVVPKGNTLLNLGGWPIQNKAGNVECGTNAEYPAPAVGKLQNPEMYQCPPNVTLQHSQIIRDPAIPVNSEVKQREPQPMETEKHQGFTERMQPYQTDAIPCNQPARRMECEQTTSQPDLNQSDSRLGHESEKEGDGIVTPKIIRDALSSGFEAREKRAIANEKLAGDEEPSNSARDSGANVAPFLASQVLKLQPSPMKSAKDEMMAVDETEEQSAPINSRLKRFSRDRLRATIDSPNIVLTPYTPLTPNVMPVVLVPDSGEESGKTGSASGSQHKDGSVFQFPPTHVSRRRAAIRLQGPTISENALGKLKNPKDSPKTPGPFPVTVENAGEKADTKGDSEQAESEPSTIDKSPALMLRGIEQSGENEKFSKNKLPTTSADAANLTSPNMDTQDDDALNTPNQPINTPNSLNTPTQLDTPNQELKTPTDSPLKITTSMKRKRDLSPVNDGGGSSEESANIKSASSAKSLRFHCFTPKDFNEGVVSCSAFRKPSEFASTPTESSILLRRRKPRKQAHPSSLSTPGEENDDASVDSENTEESAGQAGIEGNQAASNSTSFNNRKALPVGTLPFPVLSRTPDGNFFMVGNTLESQSPVLHLANPALLSIANTSEASDGPQLSSQQLNTPVLFQPTFVTPTGSGVLRKISPGTGQTGSASRPQVFTFFPSNLVTPKFSERKTSDDDKTVSSDESKSTSNKASESHAANKNQGKTLNVPKSLQMSDTDGMFSTAGPKESGLETPSNLKVVTPSLVTNSSSATSESPQIFNFPTGSSSQMVPGTKLNRDPVTSTTSKLSPLSSVTSKANTNPSKQAAPVILLPVDMLSTFTKSYHSNDAENVSNEASVSKNNQDDQKADSIQGSETSKLRRSPPSLKIVDSDKSASNSSKLSDKKSNLNPVVVTPAGMDNLSVQTPTMINLVSPSQRSPSSPLVFCPVLKQPSLSGAKTHSPLSSTSTSNTPIFMIQRVGSSSLLKSALMKSMPVFQFPPLHTPNSTTDTSPPHSEEASKPTNEPTTASSSTTPISVDSDDSAPSSAVSVIRGPSTSSPSVSVEPMDA